MDNSTLMKNFKIKNRIRIKRKSNTAKEDNLLF